MTTNTKTEILAAIGKTDDHNLKMVLLLMLGIMEEIGSKIDRIYTDKELLKQSVLNGHASSHHDDHEWLKKHREDYEIRKSFMERSKPAIDWVEERMEDEISNKKEVKRGITTILINAFEKVLWVVVGALVFAVTRDGISL